MTALPQIPGHDILTFSRMQCHKRCRRLHHYRYNLGVRKGDVARPLRFGGAMHVGWESLGLGQSIDEATIRATQPYETLPGWATTDEAVAEWMVERESVAQLLYGWWWYYTDDPDIAEFEATEFAFYLPIRNPATGARTNRWKRAGKIDGIVRLRDGRLAVLEHKTTGDDISPSSDYWLKLEFDEQISGYLLAAREMGYDVETVLYDVVRKPTIAPRQIPVLDEQGCKIVHDTDGNRVYLKDGSPRQSASARDGHSLLTRTENHKEFGERLNQDIIDRPAFYYARREIPRLHADLVEYEHDLWQQAADIREGLRAGRHFRNSGACTTMGRCEFLDLCKQGINPDEVPEGFRRVEHLHPELVSNDE